MREAEREVRPYGLQLALGFSHPIEYKAPAGIKLTAPQPTQIVIEGANKEVVGQVAAELRSLRPPEPYKGKGIKYVGEQIRRKAGKAGGKEHGTHRNSGKSGREARASASARAEVGEGHGGAAAAGGLSLAQAHHRATGG